MYQTHILDNGLKLIHQQEAGKAAYLGVIIAVGSRDEQTDEEGIAHFIEHVIFKGTQHRKAYHILSCVESGGGELNAYTTKEDTCVYASFLNQDYERVLNLFSDILFNSVFPEKELLKEQEVVIDEINSYKDTPSELIYDDFEEMVFAGNSLERTILGTDTQVRAITRERVLKFIQKHYQPNRMVISSVGDISFDKLIKYVTKYFSDKKSDGTVFKRDSIYKYERKELTKKMDTFQSHCIIGSPAYDQICDKRIPLSMLIEILGGAGMNTKLNLALRERNGLAYNIETAYTPYSDTGIFNVYFGCDAHDLNRCISLTKRELDLLCKKAFTSLQLKRLKRQIIGQITLSAENYESAMLSNGKSFLVYDKVSPLDEVYTKIESITSSQLLEVANEILAFDRQTILIYK